MCLDLTRNLQFCLQFLFFFDFRDQPLHAPRHAVECTREFTQLVLAANWNSVGKITRFDLTCSNVEIVNRSSNGSGQLKAGNTCHEFHGKEYGDDHEKTNHDWPRQRSKRT